MRRSIRLSFVAVMVALATLMLAPSSANASNDEKEERNSNPTAAVPEGVSCEGVEGGGGTAFCDCDEDGDTAACTKYLNENCYSSDEGGKGWICDKDPTAGIGGGRHEAK